MRAAWKGLRGCLRIFPSPLEALVNDHGKGLLVLPFGYEVWLSRDCDYSLSLTGRSVFSDQEEWTRVG